MTAKSGTPGTRRSVAIITHGTCHRGPAWLHLAASTTTAYSRPSPPFHGCLIAPFAASGQAERDGVSSRTHVAVAVERFSHSACLPVIFSAVRFRLRLLLSLQGYALAARIMHTEPRAIATWRYSRP